MKHILLAFIAFTISTFSFGQFKNDTIQTKKGERIIDHEFGLNVKSFAVGLLGGSPDNFETGIIYKNILPSNNALRYSLNFSNYNNLFLFQPRQTLSFSNSKKVEIYQNSSNNLVSLGMGWEYRKKTDKNYTFFVAIDGLLCYRRENRNVTISEAILNGDSTFFAGSMTKVPEFEFDSIYGVEAYEENGFGVGLKTSVGFLWALSERLNLSTALVTQGFYFYNNGVRSDFQTDSQTKQVSSTVDLTQSLVGDLTLSFRF